MDFISPIIEIVTCLWPCCLRQANYLCKLKENQDALKSAMEELKNARDDVKRRVDEAETNPIESMERTKEVNGWLQRVQTMEHEVGHILLEADKISGTGTCPGVCCCPWPGYKVGKLVFKKIAFVDELRGKGQHFEEVAYRLPPPLVQEEPVDSITLGMESIFDKVWRLLLGEDNDDQVLTSVVGLYGTGGVGKTTLLKKLNNEFLKTTHHDHFDVVILAVVTKELNVQKIQQQIGKRLRLSWADVEDLEGDQNNRAKDIFNVLTKKRFVLFLDDIWERLDLGEIGIPPLMDTNKNKSNNKLVFTTRSEDVCVEMEVNQKFRVECLDWNSSWSLFQEKVGEEALSSHPKVPELAKAVAKECGGLPLALITIGRAMSTKKTFQEWNHAVTTLKKSTSEFPDHSIQKSKLIEYWIGEGFLDGFDNIEESRNAGYDIIGSLKVACLLESGDDDEETQVKMHDLIRDLALWIASEFGKKKDKFLVPGRTEFTRIEKWEQAERISLMHNRISELTTDQVQEPPKCLNLFTLILNRNYLDKLSHNFFLFMPILRVLDLSETGILEFPISITELYDLQYLDMSRTQIKTVPEELKNLSKLKYLALSNTNSLQRISPGVVTCLSKLQVLNLYDSSFGNWDVDDQGGGGGGGPSLAELECLKHLNDLGITVNSVVALQRLLNHHKFQIYTSRLSIIDCQTLTTLTLTPVASSVGNIKHLREFSCYNCSKLLELKISLFVDDEEQETESTFSMLETLKLYKLPRLNILWEKPVNPHFKCWFQDLHHIQIRYCHGLKDLNWLIYVPSLQKLEVFNCRKIEQVISDDDDETLIMRNTFSKLKSIEFYSLPRLKSICRLVLDLCSLEFIKVWNCPQLKKLPLDSNSAAKNSLRWIDGEGDWWDELEWENETMKKTLLPFFRDSDIL